MDLEPFEQDVLARLTNDARSDRYARLRAAADASQEWREQGRDPPLVAWLDRMGERERHTSVTGALFSFAIRRAARPRSQRLDYFYIWLHKRAMQLARWL